MYEIRFRHDLNLLDIAWHGQFKAEEVAAYAREVKTQLVVQRFAPGYLLRMDMSGAVGSSCGGSFRSSEPRRWWTAPPGALPTSA